MITKLAFKLARTIADRAGLAAEWTTLKVQQYLVYLAKTLIRFAIGCTVAGLLAWYTFTYRSLVAAVLTIVVLLVSYGLLYVIAAPVQFGLAWASEKWENVKRIYHAFADMILASVLTIFYIIGDQVYDLPWAFAAFVGIYLVFLTITILPRTSLVGFAYGRIKYPVIAMVVGVTIWQHGLTANWRDEALLWRNDSPLEVTAQISPSNTIVDEKGDPLQFEPKDREGKPVPHHGRYFDENGTIHVVRMHPEETELKYQGYAVKNFSVDEILQFRKQLRSIIDKQKKAADDAARQMADQAKAEVAKQETQRKTDEDARVKAQQEENRLETQRQETQQQEVLRQQQEVQRQQREAQLRQEEDGRRAEAAEAERQRQAELVRQQREQAEQLRQTINAMDAAVVLKNSPTWPPTGFSPNGVRVFPDGEKLVLVVCRIDDDVIAIGPLKDRVFARLLHPIEYNGYIYQIGRENQDEDWASVHFNFTDPVALTDKKGKKLDNVYSINLLPEGIGTIGARSASRRKTNLPPTINIATISDSINNVYVKKPGSNKNRIMADLLTAGILGAVGGYKAGAKGVAIGAAGGVLISETAQYMTRNRNGVSFDLPEGSEFAFFIRK